MRGKPDYQSQIYYPIDIESWIVPDHPLRGVKRRADEVLSSMRKDFDRAYVALVGLEGAGLGASGRIAATLERLDFGETLPTGCWGEPPSSPSSCHRDAVML
jgi:hypothetical protein